MGIVGTDEFRRRVLAQRDLITTGVGETSKAATHAAPPESRSELNEISETLLRIESHLDRLASRDLKD